jgi:signal transduction histidine kinase
MIRSTSQTARLLILPYTALLAGYLLLAVAALVWLELQAREAGADLAAARTALLLGLLAGAVGILIAFFIARVAVRESRRAEGYFQEIYRRASLTEMAAELVHDLRNPLMALRSNATALRVSPDQAPEILAELDRDIVVLNRKLTGFLDLTRHHDDAFTPTDPAAMIAETARLAEPILAKQGLEIALDIAPNLPWPKLQAGAIRDALLNLMINPAQSGQKTGRIRVGARVVRGALRIEVDDRGCGIAPGDLSRVFTPFFTTKSEGHGLGLAVVRRIVESHHGRVRVRNREQGGVRVTLILPLEQPEIPGWWKAQTTHFPT